MERWVNSSFPHSSPRVSSPDRNLRPSDETPIRSILHISRYTNPSFSFAHPLIIFPQDMIMMTSQFLSSKVNTTSKSKKQPENFYAINTTLKLETNDSMGLPPDTLLLARITGAIQVGHELVSQVVLVQVDTNCSADACSIDSGDVDDNTTIIAKLYDHPYNYNARDDEEQSIVE